VNAMKLIAGLTGAGLLLFSGCASPAGASTLSPRGNVRRLLTAYPVEAEAARTMAPNFTRDALKTISRLEEELAVENTEK